MWRSVLVIRGSLGRIFSKVADGTTVMSKSLMGRSKNCALRRAVGTSWLIDALDTGDNADGVMLGAGRGGGVLAVHAVGVSSRVATVAAMTSFLIAALESEVES